MQRPEYPWFKKNKNVQILYRKQTSSHFKCTITRGVTIHRGTMHRNAKKLKSQTESSLFPPLFTGGAYANNVR